MNFRSEGGIMFNEVGCDAFGFNSFAGGEGDERNRTGTFLANMVSTLVMVVAFE